VNRSFLRGAVDEVGDHFGQTLEFIAGEFSECNESVIIVRLTAGPMTFLRAIPCPAVALAKEDARCADHTSAA
jgi:hypothetical protein